MGLLPLVAACVASFAALSFMAVRRAGLSPSVSSAGAVSACFFVFVLFFSLGAVHLHLSYTVLSRDASDLLKLSRSPERRVFTAQILRPPLPWDQGVRLVAGITQEERPDGPIAVSGKLRLSVRGVSPDAFDVGDWIRFSARLYPVRNFRVPGAFDSENYMALRGIRVTGLVDNPLRIVRVGHSQGSRYMNPLRYRLETARAWVIRAIDRAFNDPAVKGVAMALLVGQREWLSPEARETFARAGVGHLLAVSGLHMALVALLFGILLRFFLLRVPRLALLINVTKVSTAASLAGVVLYAGLAGFSPSAVRAMVMVVAFGFAIIVDRPQEPLNALALAAWALLLFNPLYLFSPAFQLSFAAVFFLIFFGERYRNLADGTMSKGVFSRQVQAWGFAALVGFLATAPLIQWHFQRISLVGPALNLVVVPVVSFILLPLLFLGIPGQLIHPMAGNFFWTPAACVAKGVLYLLNWFSSQDWTWCWVPAPHAHEIVILYAVLVCAALMPERARMVAGVLVYCVLLVSVPFLRQWELGRNSAMILHVLDVGQGTCQVVELPGGRLMVVDGGGLASSSFDVGRMLVAPFIRTLGYRKIDIVGLSHPQHDHIGGLPCLLREFPVGELWTGTDRGHGRDWAELMKISSARGVTHRVWSHDGMREIGEVRIRILTPSRTPGITGLNNRGLVFRLEYGGQSVLLTGDIEAEREASFLSRAPGPVDILVVPHHGSNTSSSMKFIRTLRPKTAIIPVGARNHLGLPDPEVINRYKKAGASILRTDRDGTITCRLDRS